MKFIHLTIFFAVLIHTSQQAISQPDEVSFTVFCTGNQDTTGVCYDESNPDDQKKLDCIMVPGNIIDCKNEAKEKVECILITATSAQAEFSCIKNNEFSIDYGSTTPIEENSSNQIEEIKQNNIVDSAKKNPNDASLFTDAF